MANAIWCCDIRKAVGPGSIAVIACIVSVAVAGCSAARTAIAPTPTGTPVVPAVSQIQTVTPTPTGDQPPATNDPPTATTAAPTETHTPPGQPTPQRVVFPAGGTSAVLEGRITPPDTHFYVFRALAGQNATLEITSDSGMAGFALSGMTDLQPYKRLAVLGYTWQGVLPTTQDYLVMVASLDETETDYALRLEIEPLATPTAVATVITPVITAEPMVTPIQFDPGAISAAVSGTVVWPERHYYVFRALGGQMAAIEITSAGDAANFSLVGLEDGQPYKRLENEERFWSGVLPLTGDYRIGVATPGGQAAYTLTLTINP